MNVKMKFLLVLLVMALTSCSKAKPVWKSFVFYNADDARIELLSFEGINLFHGQGPSNYGGTILHPKNLGSMDTRLDIKFSFPVRAVFRKLDGDQEFSEQQIFSVDNLKGQVLNKEGSILALFKDGKFRLIFFDGDNLLTKKRLAEMYVSEAPLNVVK